MSNNFIKSTSEIIIAYIEQFQELQLLDAQREISKLEEEIIQRRKRLLMNGDNHIIKVKQDKNTNVTTLLNMNEHYISLEELQKTLQTSIERGLNSDQIEEKQKQFGKNILAQKQKSPWYLQLLHEMTNVFSLLLWGAAALCFLAYGLSPDDPSQLYLGIVLVGVIVIITLLTYFQNRKSEAIMAGFSNFIPPEAIVIRDGQQLKIPAIELVPGDVLKYQYMISISNYSSN